MIRLLILMPLAMLGACSSDASPDDANASAPEALVSLSTATTGAVATTTTLYGSVEKGPDSQYGLASPVEATVAVVSAPPGTHVYRGTVVVRLQPSPTTRAQFAKAGGDADAAGKALARAQRLRADGLASDADVETARQTLVAARAADHAATLQAHGLALRSPGEGHVAVVAVNPGDLVATGANIATISRAGALRARFGVDPSLARQLGVGRTIKVKAGGAAFSAPILSVDPTIDPQTRLASVFVEVPAALAFGPGQPLTATVAVSRATDAVVIPYSALLDDGGQPYVYVVTAGTAHRRDVVPGPTSGNVVAITRGVAAGDQVVTNGGTAVEDGMKVRTK